MQSILPDYTVDVKWNSFDSPLDTSLIHAVCCYLSLFLVYIPFIHFPFVWLCLCAGQFYFNFKVRFHEIQLSIFLMLKYTVSTIWFPLCSNFVMKLKGNQSSSSGIGWLFIAHAVYCLFCVPLDFIEIYFQYLSTVFGRLLLNFDHPFFFPSGNQCYVYILIFLCYISIISDFKMILPWNN